MTLYPDAPTTDQPATPDTGRWVATDAFDRRHLGINRKYVINGHTDHVELLTHPNGDQAIRLGPDGISATINLTREEARALAETMLAEIEEQP